MTAIAFYLPQYHPIPENDQWWGAGFTEWTNVVRARPRFKGHYQPHLPADLGFYDLRVPDARAAQAALARDHGISAFCYYHYWFSGRRLLHRPFDEVLHSAQPDLPFCLCWANESWSRAWDGHEKQVLISQDYSPDDDRAHIQWLLSAFADPRYLRVDGRPLFLVYKAGKLPDPAATTRLWRQAAKAHGLGDLFLARVESGPDETGDPRPLGFDAAVEFQPRWRTAFGNAYKRRLFYRLARSLHLLHPAHVSNSILDYDAYIDSVIAEPPPDYPCFKSVCPSWDNSARRARGAFIFKNASPQSYERWLRWASDPSQFANTRSATAQPLLFINAWNEWAEGNHLEPCAKWGRAYLEATRNTLSPISPPRAHTNGQPAS